MNEHKPNNVHDKGMRWADAWLVYTRPKVISLLFLGFSAGLPLLLVFSTLSAWLRDESVTRTTIGFFGWIGITYSIKVFWAPIVDRVPIPFLSRFMGHRRSWMLVAQVGIVAGLFVMSLCTPASQLTLFALAAVFVAFCSATQDISIDAFRIEAADKKIQGAMAASYILGYRLAMLLAGAGALMLADVGSWVLSYQSMALCGLVGILTTLVVREPALNQNRYSPSLEPAAQEFLKRAAHRPEIFQRAGAWFIGAVVGPFADFFKRNSQLALWILLFIGLYRVSDITMGIMANPFYLDMGYSKTEIAQISKIFGFCMTIFGSMVGGVLVLRFGVMRPLLWGAFMLAITNLLFAFLALIMQAGEGTAWLQALQTHRLSILAAVISADNLSGGIAQTAFIAYASGLTNLKYTATQYALFSSLMTLPGKFISGFSGVIVDSYGYVAFFTYAAFMGIPAIMLVIYLMKLMARVSNNEEQESSQDDEGQASKPVNS